MILLNFDDDGNGVDDPWHTMEWGCLLAALSMGPDFDETRLRCDVAVAPSI